MFKNIYGVIYKLDSEVTTNPILGMKLEKIYAHEAYLAMKRTQKPIFYSLKKLEEDIFSEYRLFIVPIEQAEVDVIANQFGNDYLIGIQYVR